MWSDAIDLRNFYSTPLGKVTRRIMQRNLRAIWRDVHGKTVLGIGYATPYLQVFQEEAARTLAVMPPQQGVLRWPEQGRNQVALAEEASLPLSDRSVDRVLLVHALESSEQLRHLLRELWRVTADDGRILAVVPNRRGIWARLDRTPFGHGHPFSQDQIIRLLRETMYTPVRTEYGLFMPPSRRKLPVHWGVTWERVGYRWFPRFGGVLMVEASKEIYAAVPEGVRPRRARIYATIPGGVDSASRGASRRADGVAGSD